MAIVLYDNPVSGNCHKVRLILGMLGIEFERREVSVVDRSGRDETLGGLSPSLTLPTVLLEDGRPLTESNAILWHFAEGSDYLPDDPYLRAQVLQWMFFEQYKHEPGIAVVRYWVSITDSPPSEKAVEFRRREGFEALATMDRHLDGRDYLVGDSFTIADIALYAYTHVAHEGGFDLEPYPAVRAWVDRIGREPGVVPMAALSGPA